MLAIRLNRTGKKNRAHFRVAVQEHTKAPGKRHVEIVGSYDPHKKTTILNKERILHWIGNGAQVSPAVHNMLVREGVIDGKKIAKKMPRPVVKEEPKAETAEEAAPAAEVIPPVETPVTEPVAEAVATEVAPEKAETQSVEEKKEEAKEIAGSETPEVAEAPKA